MTTAQRAIGSGFGAASTAGEVLAGVDLRGRLALVTGGYSGIGLATTRALAGAGAHVVVPARRVAIAEEALAGMDGVEVDSLNLADLAEVTAFAQRFLATGRRLDVIINNAGIMAWPPGRVGPGWDAQFAINHLGHFALVNRLWPALAPGARVVSVSSRGHHLSGMRWDDVDFDLGYDKWLAYGQSKTANVLFAVHLDRLGREHGVRAFSLHPGGIVTNLGRHLTQKDWQDIGVVDEAGNVVATGLKTQEQGAATQVWAATSPRLAGMGGVYCEDCEIAEPAPADGTRAGVRDHAVDPEQAARLWELSARRTGVDVFA